VLSFFRELPVLLVIAFLLALLIKTFLVQAFFIPSESMFPTLDVGDRVLVNKVVYRLHPPRRGDIIVFEEPNSLPQPDRGPVIAFLRWLTQGLGVTANPEKDFIKRVIGLPGDVVEIHRGAVYVDGERLDEPYLATPRDRRSFPPVEVPEGMLYVLGDNRLHSGDSRFGLGFVPLGRVVGKAFVVVWPPSRVGWIR
jgi:signal peptidase I